MSAPGELIGWGRSADIYAIGEAKVLRRSREGPIGPEEVAVMAAVRDAGYPVPRVYSVDGCDMVMDRVVGPDLLTRLSKRPWEVRRVGVMLAELHRRLAAIPLGDTDLPAKFGMAEAFVHGDLHPGNVLLTEQGPVVIDWANAGLGARDADTATTWMLLETAEADGVPLVVRPLAGAVRRSLVRALLRATPRPRPDTIDIVCDDRLTDEHMRPGEIDRIRSFAARHTS